MKLAIAALLLASCLTIASANASQFHEVSQAEARSVRSPDGSLIAHVQPAPLNSDDDATISVMSGKRVVGRTGLRRSGWLGWCGRYLVFVDAHGVEDTRLQVFDPAKTAQFGMQADKPIRNYVRSRIPKGEEVLYYELSAPRCSGTRLQVKLYLATSSERTFKRRDWTGRYVIDLESNRFIAAAWGPEF